MPRWTQERLRAYENRRTPPRAKLEPPVQDESVAKAAGEIKHTGRITVRVASYRRRLLDPDNLTGGTKYFIDGLRYAGLIPGDRPDQITLEVSQHKVATDERTEIEIV